MKPIIELNTEQINNAVDGLPLREKLRLTERLEKETFSFRWKQILKDIDSRLKNCRISRKDVLNEIESYRKEKYA
jgi:hypothetical protein